MRKLRVLAVIMVLVMACAMIGCKSGGDNETPDNTASTGSAENTSTPEPTQEPVNEPAQNNAPVSAVVEGPASIDFEDGNTGFFRLFTSSPKADASELALTQFNGSRALSVKREKGSFIAYVAFDAVGLLGSNAGNVKKVQVDLAVDNTTFNAMSGKLAFFTNGEVNEASGTTWSVYMANKNPKTVEVELNDVTFGDETPVFFIELTDDASTDTGHELGNLIIDNIRFLDGSGNLVEADTAIEFASYEGFEGSSGPDRTNLFALDGVVEFPDFVASGDAWAQAGFDMTEEFVNALVPGSVIEISFSSETGDVWCVFPAADAGWTRAGVGEDYNGGDMYFNDSHDTAQLYFEDIAALLGEDTSAWGATLQCESSGNWEVYSVKVGQKAVEKEFVAAAEIPDFAVSADGWAQAGFAMTDEFINALVPGSVVEISYSSGSGALWVVLNEAQVGWTRSGDGTLAGAEDHELAICDGSKCYIPFEMLANTYGEDVSTWGSSLQCESNDAWEVYSVKVGTLEEKVSGTFTADAEIPDFVTSADGWAQAGFAMTDEFISALVPGSVVEISYTSETGALWVVLNEAAIGWTRSGDGDLAGASDHELASFDGAKCYIPYEMLARTYGDDVAAWGGSLQCESNGAWEVYSVKVGHFVEAPKLRDLREVPGFTTSAGEWSQAGFDLPDDILGKLVPGSVLKISYSSDSGALWVLFNGAQVGWVRCGDGDLAGAEDHELAIFDGSVCYVPYEMLANTYGENVGEWGTSLQCESNSAWEVYSVSVGRR